MRTDASTSFVRSLRSLSPLGRVSEERPAAAPNDALVGPAKSDPTRTEGGSRSAPLGLPPSTHCRDAAPGQGPVVPPLCVSREFTVWATGRTSPVIDCSPADPATVKARCAAEGLQVLGLRFEGDRIAPGERFEFLRRQLGDSFVSVELPDDTANPDAFGTPHSVVTEHLIDEPGQPTRQALDQVLDLFRARLLGSA